MGARLFEKLPAGYRPTPAGEDVRAHAEEIEQHFDEMGVAVAGRDAAPSGVVRVATIDVLMPSLVQHLAAFRAAYPGIVLDVLTGPRIVNLARGEADVALRLTNSPAQTLVGQRIGPMALAAYASAEYLQALPPHTSPESMSWVGWNEDMRLHPSAHWVEHHAETIGIRVSSSHSVHASVLAGLGAGFLNCFVADRHESLWQIMPPNPTHTLDLWVLTPEELRTTTRVRLFSAFISKALRGERDLMSGARARAWRGDIPRSG